MQISALRVTPFFCIFFVLCPPPPPPLPTTDRILNMPSIGSILHDGVWMGPYIASTQNAAKRREMPLALFGQHFLKLAPHQKAGSAPA